MLRLVVATLAALYFIAITAGERPEGEVVARAADPEFELSLSSFVGAAEASVTEEQPSLTEAEAIAIALATGAELRKGRSVSPLLGTSESAAMIAEAREAARAVELWKVSGDVVNLRAGPGTDHGVVAKLTLGTEAEVLEDTGSWIRIRTADGAVDGWIFGKYLQRV